MSGKDVYDIIHEKYDKRWKKEELIVDADRFKTYDEVFDRQNLDNIFRLMKRGRIKTVEYPISTGKEANVYNVETKEGPAAMKVFRTSTSTFNSYIEYIEGDRRFQRIDRSKRGIIYTWAKKEYLNLETLSESGLNFPEPRALFRNVLVMDYIEYEGLPAPQLRILDAEKHEWSEMFADVIATVRKAFKDCEIVHADLSEYNILYDGKPVYIDVGQSVNREHPRAMELLKRDLEIISAFFGRKGIKEAEETASSLYTELIGLLREEKEDS